MKIKDIFKRKPDQKLEEVQRLLTINNDHLIAIARLSFIKPSRLVTEAQNTKENAEYLLEMIKAKEKELK